MQIYIIYLFKIRHRVTGCCGLGFACSSVPVFFITVEILNWSRKRKLRRNGHSSLLSIFAFRWGRWWFLCWYSLLSLFRSLQVSLALCRNLIWIINTWRSCLLYQMSKRRRPVWATSRGGISFLEWYTYYKQTLCFISFNLCISCMYFYLIIICG